MKYKYNDLVYWGNQELINEILKLAKQLERYKKG